MIGQKGVIVMGLIVLGTIWISVLLGMMVIRSEANALIDRARMTDPSITEHVALITGNGGLGKYLMIRIDEPHEEAFERCPGLPSNAICMRIK